MYFVFYNGDYHGETRNNFPPGLNCAYDDNIRDIMQIVAREVPMPPGQSLLFDWLHGVYNAQEDSTRLSDADVQNIDIDS